MTLKEFLDIREHRFDDSNLGRTSLYYRGYMDGWTDVVKDIRTVLERHGFNLEIPLD